MPKPHGKPTAKSLLIFGLLFNLGLLGYYKYANFFVDNLSRFSAANFHLEKILLPLAISFFTFQQITYLIDVYQGHSREYCFLPYCLFVTFFPQLIAGPIVHHKEMLPQFSEQKTFIFNWDNLSLGTAIFFIGLFKKVVLADHLATFSTGTFQTAESGTLLTFFEAWSGALCYTFQLYFDFSGYSDMAVGLARMFGILLPINFNSPYQAINITEFWRRWHITLSRFLRDYLYIPLGGNRKGPSRRLVNLMITMLLGGMWHGAGWTFIAWGALHGIYLVINHGWRSFREKLLGQDISRTSWIGRNTGRFITFIAVVVGWVFFRAESFSTAIEMLKSMSGLRGIVLINKFAGINIFETLANNFTWITIAEIRLPHFGPLEGVSLLAAASIVFLLPNTMQIMKNFKSALYCEAIDDAPRALQFKFNPALALALGILIFICFLTIQTIQVSEFLYYDF